MSKGTLTMALAALAVGLLSACTQTTNEKEVVQMLPPQKVEKSIQPTEQAGLKIQKSSLGKLFLLRATVKSLKSAASWEDLKPMLVSFEKSGDSLGMFEMDTYATYKVIDTKRLVTTFKITSETEAELSFEWGEGLKVVNRPFYDDPEDKDDTAAKENSQGLSSSVETVSSFTKSTSLRDNQIHVRQDLRVRASFIRVKAADPSKPNEKTPSLQTREMAVEVDYVLKPYDVNPRFQPKEIDPLHRIGFFQTSVGKENRSMSKTVYAAHWDMSPEAGPITFALSKHFPADVIDAVKEGVLYWNTVIGADKIRIIENFDPESDFPDRTVVVNWLPWEDAGASWANFQSDPLTGEILRGQIYLTSVFLKLSKQYPQSEDQQVLALDGMPSNRTCRFPVEPLKFPNGATSSLKKQFILDQLRHVVAHEAGHTMGLRHNFAGSMDSALKVSEINAEKIKYETDINYRGAALSSTIMDYIRGLEEGMIGRFVKYKALGYDADVLKWVNSSQIEADTKYSFCTDDDIEIATEKKESLFGCERFDVPANPFNIRADETKRILNNLVGMKFDSLIDRMYPEGSDKVLELEAVLDADYKTTYASLMSSRETAITSLVSMPFSYLYQVTGPNEDTVVYYKNRTENRWDSTSTSLNDVVKTHLVEAGGIAPLLKAILPLTGTGDLDSQFLDQQLKALKESGRIAKGTTSGGRAYQLSEQQQARIEKYLQKGMEYFVPTILSTVISLKPYQDKEVTETGKTGKESKNFLSNVGQEQWFPEFSKLLKGLILSQKDVKSEQLNGREIRYPVSAVASYYRTSLVQMMSPSVWQAGSLPKIDIEFVRATLISNLKTLYGELELGPDLLPPTTDAVADHESFVTKLILAGKIPSSIAALANEDILVLKEVDKIK